MPPTSSTPPHGLRLITILAFLGFFAVGGAWAIATPWDGGPDEQAHIIRAAGVVGGDIAAPLVKVPREGVGPPLPGVRQTVPAGVSRSVPAGPSRSSPACFAFKPQQPATCLAPAPAAPERLVKRFTSTGRYQPTYGALVGWPLKWWPNDTGLLLARLIGAALSAGFLAAAVHSVLAWSRRPFLLAGVLVAATPMAMHLTGVINPNGLEITAAIAMWTALIPLVLGDGPVDRRLLILAGVSASVAACLRPAGPLLVALALAVLLGTAGRARVSRLARDRRVWVMAAIVTFVSLASGIWTIVMKANELVAVPGGAGLGVWDAIRVVVVERTSFYLRSMVGIFGWVDIEMPTGFYAVWFAAAGFLVLAALAVGRRSDRWRLALVVVVAFGLPLSMDLFGAKTMGMGAQGRYILPSAVGAALLAAYIIDERGLFTAAIARSVVGWLAVITLPAQLVALAYTMIRYQHGLGAKVPVVNPLSGPWQPPLGSATALATAVGGLVALGAVIWLATRQRPPDPEAIHSGGVPTVEEGGAADQRPVRAG